MRKFVRFPRAPFGARNVSAADRGQRSWTRLAPRLFSGVPRDANWGRRRDLHSRGVSSAVYKTAAVAAEPRRRNNYRRRRVALCVLIGASSRRLLRWCGNWSSIRVLRPVFRFGRPACVYQHLCSMKLESRAGIAPAWAVLRTAAWADRPTGFECGRMPPSARNV